RPQNDTPIDEPLTPFEKLNLQRLHHAANLSVTQDVTWETEEPDVNLRRLRKKPRNKKVTHHLTEDEKARLKGHAVMSLRADFNESEIHEEAQVMADAIVLSVPQDESLTQPPQTLQPTSLKPSFPRENRGRVNYTGVDVLYNYFRLIGVQQAEINPQHPDLTTKQQQRLIEKTIFSLRSSLKEAQTNIETPLDTGATESETH